MVELAELIVGAIVRGISGLLFLAVIVMAIYRFTSGRARRKGRVAPALEDGKTLRGVEDRRARVPEPGSDATKYASLLGQEDCERLSAEACAAILAERRNALREKTRKMRILLVDNEPVIANTLKIILNQGGYQGLSAHSKAGAMQIILHDKPDLIWTDMSLEKVDSGVEIYRYLRDHNMPIGVHLYSGWIDGLKAIGLEPEDFPNLACTPKLLHPTEIFAILGAYFEEQAAGGVPNTVA